MGNMLLPALSAPPPVSKATQTEWKCPVCRSVHVNSDAVPCGHQFCMSCLLRHAAASPTCPLCSSPVLSVRFSVLRHNDFLQCIINPPGVPLAPGSWARRGVFRLMYTRPQRSAAQGAPCPPEPVAAGPEASEGFPPDLWVELLYGQEHLLDPVRPWLRQSLDAIYGPQWWEARQVESITLSTLCICGPDREVLTYMLERYLREYTAPLIHGLIHITMHQCRDAWLLRRAQAALEEGESAGATTSPPPLPVWIPSPSQAPGLESQAASTDPAGPGAAEQPSAPEPAQPGGLSWPPFAPAAARQDRPPDMPQEDTAAPGPSRPRRRSRHRTRHRTRNRPIQRTHRRRAPRCRPAPRSRRRRPKRR